ncbi:MAG: tetratricopeptide repeat protein [Henriciella sp.]|nr:tetratricopeptide repeat protein [Henriciella sp.]
MRYAFGPFELDTSTLELTRAGEVLSIEPQVFEMLAYLIENRDRVLSKDDLIEAVWGGRIVSDSAISSRIKLVRRAVDDDGTRQSVIKTVHGKGFRFVADIHPVEDQANRVETPPKTPEAPPKTAQTPAETVRKRFVPIALVASAVLGLFLILQLFPSRAQVTDNRIAVLPVQNETGEPSLDWATLGLMSLVTHALEARSELPVVSERTMLTLTDRFPVENAADLIPGEKLKTALQDGYGASHFLVSKLTGSADNLTLEYRVINPRGQSAPAAVSGQLAAELAEEMSRQVAATLPRSGERQRDESAEMFDDAYVAETYARGLDSQLQGKADEAVDMFRAAMAQSPDSLEIQHELAVSMRMAGDLDAAEAQFLTVIEKAETAEDAQIVGAALNGLGIVHMTRRDNETALATFEHVLRVVQRGEAPEIRAHAYTNIGIIERRLRNFDAAEDALGLARIAYQEAGYERTPGSLLNSMANLKAQQRDLPSAMAYLEEALDFHRVVGDRPAEAIVLHNLGTNAVSLGEYERAETLLRQALEMRTEMKDFRGQISSLFGLAGMLINNGHVDPADEYADQIEQLSQAAEDSYQFARGQGLAAHIDFVRGDWAAALAHSSAAEAVYVDMSRTRNAYQEQIRQTVIRGYSGSPADRSIVQQILDWALAEDQKGTQLHAYEALNVLDLLDGDYEAAAVQIDAAVAVVSDIRLTAATGRISARQGLIRLVLGDQTGARASLGRAQTDNPGHQETLLLQGLLARADGDFESGAELIAQAKAKAGANWHWTERLFLTALDGT